MNRQRPTGPKALGDFSVTPRVLLLVGLSVPVGALAAGAAWVLLRLIALVTNLVFYGQFATEMRAPGAMHHPWWLILCAPVIGGLIVGVMARYGSEKIRGHGMPEAIEAILVGGSRVQPKVAILKPVSAAISIGTGGPFGAEGPIIMTGGAVGSILAQHLHLTADERKTLLVSGAAAGMAATFNTPLAAVLLAVELLLFEWRVRSFAPVATAVVVADLMRVPLLGGTPIFPVHTLVSSIAPTTTVLAVLVGITGAALAYVATRLVYAAEDAFARLPFHWMWWPAVGGAIIGIGGLIQPRALGVGYDVIDELLTGRATLGLIISLLVVKTAIWSLSLGSGTSGGVLAPIFMIGGALGALEGMALPHVFPGFWAMLGLAAVVGGVMRSPLTGVIFTLELTHAWVALLPLIVVSVTAYLISALTLPRSVLTEKIARRGLHLTRDYVTDPLETFLAGDVARAVDLAGAPATAPHVLERATLRHVANEMAVNDADLAVVVDRTGRATGLIGYPELMAARLHDLTEDTERQRHLALPRPWLRARV
ncbi:chloride channel protein [Calidifontibacter terrae]